MGAYGVCQRAGRGRRPFLRVSHWGHRDEWGDARGDEMQASCVVRAGGSRHPDKMRGSCFWQVQSLSGFWRCEWNCLLGGGPRCTARLLIGGLGSIAPLQPRESRKRPVRVAAAGEVGSGVDQEREGRFLVWRRVRGEARARDSPSTATPWVEDQCGCGIASAPSDPRPPTSGSCAPNDVLSSAGTPPHPPSPSESPAPPPLISQGRRHVEPCW